MAGGAGGRAASPAPSWEGHYACPECGEAFRFHRGDMGGDMPDDAYVQVAHVHSDGGAGWYLSSYRRKAGDRWPPHTKALQLIVDSQKRATRQGRLDPKAGF